jgi:rhodanese-related sulfurtransferase
MPTTADELVSRARSQVANLTADQVASAASRGALLVDLREPAEPHAIGMIPRAVRAARGLYEFWADSANPDHRPEFRRRTVVHCSTGARSALAALLLRQLDFADAAHLDGGVEDRIRTGDPVVSPSRA